MTSLLERASEYSPSHLLNKVLRTAVDTSLEHTRRRSETLTQILVSLGQRNQALIDRQLDLIDARVLVVSFSNEGYIEREAMEALLATRAMQGLIAAPIAPALAGMDAQQIVDDFRARAGGLPGGNEGIGQLAGLPLIGEEAGLELQQFLHGDSPWVEQPNGAA